MVLSTPKDMKRGPMWSSAPTFRIKDNKVMKVTFQIEGGSPVEIECNAGDNLLELARRANVAIDAPCSGNGSCGKCRVKLLEGQLDTIPSRHISDEEYSQGWRLSCNSKVVGDCTVLVPDIASAYQSRMKTADLSSPEEVAIFEEAQRQLKESGIAFENQYRVLELSMSAPSEDDTMPDVERLTWAVQEAAGVEKVTLKATMCRWRNITYLKVEGGEKYPTGTVSRLRFAVNVISRHITIRMRWIIFIAKDRKKQKQTE